MDEVYWPLHYWIVQKQIKQNKEETVMETSCTYYSKEEIGNIFHGPLNSSWMTFSYNISDSNLRKMPALEHPDNTTRCQTLDYEDDPWLYDLITKFKEMTGLGVLVNTSFNGPDEPIIENYNQAIDWYLKN